MLFNWQLNKEFGRSGIKLLFIMSLVFLLTGEL